MTRPGLVAVGPRARTAMGVVALLGLAALARAATFAAPLGEDTTAFLYIGDVILDGGTPYVDAADNKGPLLYLLFAAIEGIAGHSTALVRAALLPAVVIAALATGAYVRQAADRRAGAIAALLVALIGSAPAMYGEDPTAEQFAIAPLAAAWLCSSRRRSRDAALAGALFGAAVMLNVGFVAFAPVLLYELWRGGDRARIGVAVLGGVAVAVPLVAWLFVRHALDDAGVQVLGQFADALRGDVSPYVVERPRTLGALLGEGTPAKGLWLLAGSACALALRRRPTRAAALGSALWLLVAYLRVKASSYEWPYHYYLAVPGMAASVALGLAASRGAIRTIVVAASVLAIVAYVAVPQIVFLQRPPAERHTDYDLDPGTYDGYAAAGPIGAFLRARTRPSDRIIVAGTGGHVYWHADRRAPGRFFSMYPVAGRPRYVRERRRVLLARPPAAVVVTAEDRLDPALEELLRAHPYELARVPGGRVWLLR